SGRRILGVDRRDQRELVRGRAVEPADGLHRGRAPAAQLGQGHHEDPRLGRRGRLTGVPYLVGPVLRPGTWSRQPQPVVSDGPRRLRPWTAHDAPSLVEAYADADIQQWHGRTMTLPEAQEWIRAKGDAWGRESA